jgi:hypothetical protein
MNTTYVRLHVIDDRVPLYCAYSRTFTTTTLLRHYYDTTTTLLLQH